METTEDDMESVIPPLLLLRTTPPLFPSGETRLLDGLDLIDPLIWPSPDDPTG